LRVYFLPTCPTGRKGQYISRMKGKATEDRAYLCSITVLRLIGRVGL